MSASVTFTGLAELREALRRLPEELRDEAATIVQEAANTAADAIRSAYPIGPDRKNHKGGNLRKGVRVETIPGASRHGAAAVVKSTAQHAWLFENGTQTRKTALGYNRGAVPKPMPPGRVFVPIAIREREVMEERLIAVVERAGLTVHQ